MKLTFALLSFLIGCTASSNRVPERHRVEGVMCDSEREVSVVDTSLDGCDAHEECTEGNDGRCVPVTDEPPGPSRNECTYDACAGDSDCDSGPCRCGFAAGANRCFQGNCQVDADCGESGFCSPSYGDCYDRRVVGYFCHTPEDHCTNDSDCTERDSSSDTQSYCLFAGSSWRCNDPDCTI